MLTWEIGKYRESPVLCMWNVEAIFQQNLNQKQYKKQQTIIKQTFQHECKCKYKNIIFGEREEEMDRERNYLNVVVDQIIGLQLHLHVDQIIL